MKENISTGRPRKISEAVAKRLIDLTSCISYLEKTGNLARVKSAVSSKYELAGIAKKFEGRKCILFEQVKGSKYPVFVGMLWNRDIVGSLFEMPKEKVPFVIEKAIRRWKKNKSSFSSRTLKKGPANEVVEEEVNLFRLPIPVHAMRDGGRYLDSSLVVVKNPETGVPNTSIHRMMVSQKGRLTFLIDPDRHLGAYLDIMEKRGKPLQVTINNGIGLVPWLVSAIPGQGDGKYGIANHIIGSPIDFIKAQTVDAPAYAGAQFVNTEEGGEVHVVGIYPGDVDVSGVINKPGRYMITFYIEPGDRVENGWHRSRCSICSNSSACAASSRGM